MITATKKNISFQRGTKLAVVEQINFLSAHNNDYQESLDSDSFVEIF